MKLLIYVMLISMSFISIDANACPRSLKQIICPGDRAVTDDNYPGVIAGVNPFADSVAIKTDRGFTTTRSKETIALGVGCLEMYCVGDKAVTDDNYDGIIAGVNPYSGEIAILTKRGFHTTRRIDSIALGLGCVRGICVDDLVVTDDNYEGRVVGVNAYSRSVAVLTTRGFITTRSTNSVSNSAYCDTYGERERMIERYPIVNEQMFLSPSVRFSAKRPRRY